MTRTRPQPNLKIEIVSADNGLGTKTAIPIIGIYSQEFLREKKGSNKKIGICKIK